MDSARRLLAALLIALLSFGSAGCGDDADGGQGGDTSAEEGGADGGDQGENDSGY